VAIGETGQISVNDTPVDIAGLPGALAKEFEKGSDRSVILRADGNVKHSVIVRVLDIARLSGAERLSIAAENVKTR